MDDKDKVILAERLAAFNKRTGPRVGDYVRLLDGKLHRFSHDWGDGLQHSQGGSFYLDKGGYVSFSGSLESAIPNEQLESTEERLDGFVWFFHRDWWTAHNGIDAKVEFRVYRQLDPKLEHGKLMHSILRGGGETF